MVFAGPVSLLVSHSIVVAMHFDLTDLGKHSGRFVMIYSKNMTIRSMDTIGSPKKSKCSSISRDKIERNLGHP